MQIAYNQFFYNLKIVLLSQFNLIRHCSLRSDNDFLALLKGIKIEKPVIKTDHYCFNLLIFNCLWFLSCT